MHFWLSHLQVANIWWSPIKSMGEGRSDVAVKDMRGGRIAIFEAKYSKSLEQLEDACHTALRQINDRMYAKEYEDDYDEILCYGIAFYKKRCMVKKIVKNLITVFRK